MLEFDRHGFGGVQLKPGAGRQLCGGRLWGPLEAVLTGMGSKTHHLPELASLSHARGELGGRCEWRRETTSRVNQESNSECVVCSAATPEAKHLFCALESIEPMPPAVLIAQAKSAAERAMRTGAEYCSTTLMLSMPRTMMNTWAAQKV